LLLLTALVAKLRPEVSLCPAAVVAKASPVAIVPFKISGTYLAPTALAASNPAPK
jgi:hypothetical protein